MQAIMETLFDVIYLCTVVTVGINMIKNSNRNKQYKLFGIMAVLLGGGDAFHLVPRAYGLLTIGLEANAVALGFGKLVTSITMTFFYLILYNIWRFRYKINGREKLSATIYILAAIRIVLCCFPQNEWFVYNQPLNWGIYRNIPFAIMGIIIIALFFVEAKRNNDHMFKYMWLAITLSFVFYAPVVLFSNTLPIVGALMIPKTLAYVWIVFMGFFDMKESANTLNISNKTYQKYN